MSEENTEQTFEDAFDELVDGSTSSAETSTAEEETQDGALQGQEEEAQEQARVLDPEQDPEPEPEPQEGSEQDAEEHSVAALQDELRQWKHKYNSDLGRQNAYQRQLKERDEEIAKLRSAQSPNPGIDDATWETTKQDYPDIAEGVAAFYKTQGQKHQAEIDALKAQLAPIQGQLHESYVAQQYQMLAQEHPDWNEVAASEKFRNWVSMQPQNVQEMMESEQAGDAAYLLRVYKNEVSEATAQTTSNLKQRREKQLRQGQNVPSRGGRSQQVMPPDDDFDAAFDYFVEKDARQY
jgi:hypothetical protein